MTKTEYRIAFAREFRFQVLGYRSSYNYAAEQQETSVEPSQSVRCRSLHDAENYALEYRSRWDITRVELRDLHNCTTQAWTKTVINHIGIPAEFVTLAEQWYDGQASMLYAIASTGKLETGTHRPEGFTDEQWYVNLWDTLDCELSGLIRMMRGTATDGLIRFQRFAEDVSNRLRVQYGMEV